MAFPQNPTTSASLSSATIINYITDEVRVLEPDLQFAKLGLRRDAPEGYGAIAFPQYNIIGTSSVSTIATSSNTTNEGLPTTPIINGTSAYVANWNQYGIVVQYSDVALRNTGFQFFQSAAWQIRMSIARQVDNFIQGVLTAGTNVVYSGGKASRAALAAGDIITANDWQRAITALRKASSGASVVGGVKPYTDNCYIAIMHPSVEADMLISTNVGSWSDFSRFDQTGRLAEGTLGKFRGAIGVVSGNVQTFSSTVTVYPTVFVGKESFGWGYFQQPQVFFVDGADSGNPIAQYKTIGAKVMVGAVLFEQSRVVRIESATVN